MKVVFTDPALDDLSEIRRYLQAHYPSIATSVEKRLRIVIGRVSQWPESAPSVVERPGVHVALLVRYPYKIFYRITDEVVEILHIHHTSQRTP
jgi:plasmid stabilization system protein ParE